MASYTISPVWGAGAQLFDNNGNPLSGGKIFTYAAGSSTPLTTYTTPIGNVANTNPIVADSAGRLNSEIWFPVSGAYKFVLKDSNDVLLATYDNIPTTPQPPIINDASSVSYQQGYTVSAGAFTVGETYLITSVGTTDFVAIGAGANTTGVLFTATGVGSGTGEAQYSRTVQTKLRETISIKDFGAVGDGVTDDTISIQAALTYAGTIKCAVYVPGTSSSYLATNVFTVPDGVTVYGDGWGSFIQQTTQNKDVFIAGNCNTFQNLRLKIVDGDDTVFTNCIYAVSVNNLTVENCNLELADFGCCGVHIRSVKNSKIINNRIYNGKWTSGGGPGTSASDILLYSFSESERHIIQGNHCLSNNSQGIYASALGFDGDIIISNNICVALDPATCTETGTWSLIANGGRRRHGIIVSYSISQAGRPRTIVDGNICRNTGWTGIYKQGQSSGEIIISNNLCDLNGYQDTSLSGGIYLESGGVVNLIGNTTSNFQNGGTVSPGKGGITVNQASNDNLTTNISNNKIINSLGNGIASGTSSQLLNIQNNIIENSALTDIYVSLNVGVADAGGHNIINNTINRKSGNNLPSIYYDQGNSTRYALISNNIINGFDNTNNDVGNAGVSVRRPTALVRVIGNSISNFYYGFICSNYYVGRFPDNLIENNIITDCAVGFGVSAGDNISTLPLVGNRFINTPTLVSSPIGYAVGRIVDRLGQNLIWQTTAIPTVGSWVVGDRSVNSTPAVGQPKAWACTVTGTPGTWVSEGNL